MSRFSMLLFAVLITLAAAKVAPSSKIGATLQQQLDQHHTNGIDILISMKAGTTSILADVTLQKFSSRTEKLNTLRTSLKKHAASTQAPVTGLLTSKSVSFKSFWINNQILVKGASAELIHELGQHDAVSAINVDERIPLVAYGQAVPSENTILAEWGVSDIKADFVWQLGSNGTGASVAIVATGARSTHEALTASYMGQYGWFDPYSGSMNPSDNNGLGTYTAGIVAGADGIGVAPGATWQACLGCDGASCATSALIACGEWVACPTMYDGSAPDCSKAPNVVVNAWGAGGGQNFYDDVIRALRLADVIPVFGAGAATGSCGAVGSPGDSAAGVLTVGAYTEAHSVTSASGPSMQDILKPDLVGPGTNIRSAWYTSDISYNTLSSTGNGPAHIAGAIALLKGEKPDISSNQIYSSLAGTTDSVTPGGQTCGGVSDSVYPNNAAGYGRLNVLRAYLDCCYTRKV